MAQLATTESEPRNRTAPRDDPRQQLPAEGLLSDEPTIELVIRAKNGDNLAVEAILQRCLPPLRRWAHAKLPAAARGHLDTGDLVQEAAFHVLGRLDVFEPRHVGALQAYLRQSINNRIRDEVRRVTRRPERVELMNDPPSTGVSPLEAAIQTETYQRYRDALKGLSSRDRQLVLARLEAQWSLPEIAAHFGMRTVDATRMAVTRALRRLATQLAT